MEENQLSTRGRWIETACVVLMAISSLGTTWSSYESSMWGGKSKTLAAEANNLDREAGVLQIEGLQFQSTQVQVMLHAFEARIAGSIENEQFLVARLAPIAVSAYEKWIATDPLHNPDAPRHPFIPEWYEPPLAKDVAEKLKLASSRTIESGRTGEISSRYLSQSVLLATVLFFLGISARFHSAAIRHGAFWFGAALLAYAASCVVMLPVA